MHSIYELHPHQAHTFISIVVLVLTIQ